YQQVVEIRRVYNDPSTNAVLASPHRDEDGNLTPGSEYSQTAAMWVQNARSGIVEVDPATWDADNGEWKQATSNILAPTFGVWPDRAYAWRNRGIPTVRLNYLAGVQKLNTQQEWTVIRLAHSLIPERPCGCDVTA